jgi:hypothetical protein
MCCAYLEGMLLLGHGCESVQYRVMQNVSFPLALGIQGVSKP